MARSRAACNAIKAAALGPKGLAELRAFVVNGGGYVGICAGAYLGLSGYCAERSLVTLS